MSDRCERCFQQSQYCRCENPATSAPREREAFEALLAECAVAIGKCIAGVKHATIDEYRQERKDRKAAVLAAFDAARARDAAPVAVICRSDAETGSQRSVYEICLIDGPKLPHGTMLYPEQS